MDCSEISEASYAASSIPIFARWAEPGMSLPEEKMSPDVGRSKHMEGIGNLNDKIPRARKNGAKR